MGSSEELRVPPRYLDLDDIIAMNTPITCTVYDTLDKGLLHSYSGKRQFQEFFKLFNLPIPEAIDSRGVKVNVPLWLLGKIRNHCEVCVSCSFLIQHL